MPTVIAPAVSKLTATLTVAPSQEVVATEHAAEYLEEFKTQSAFRFSTKGIDLIRQYANAMLVDPSKAKAEFKGSAMQLRAYADELLIKALSKDGSPMLAKVLGVIFTSDALATGVTAADLAALTADVLWDALRVVLTKNLSKFDVRYREVDMTDVEIVKWDKAAAAFILSVERVAAFINGDDIAAIAGAADIMKAYGNGKFKSIHTDQVCIATAIQIMVVGKALGHAQIRSARATASKSKK